MKKFISTILAFVAILFYCQAQNTPPQAKPGKPSKHDFANRSLSNLIAPTSVNVNLLPGTNASKNLGSPAKKWKNLYLSGSLISAGDARINGVTVGRGTGSGSDITSSNTAVGNSALNANTTGTWNTAIGENSLNSNTVGTSNTAVGNNVLNSNTTGHNNTAIGRIALYSNTSGVQNTANGMFALYSNTTGYNNTAVGYNIMINNTTGNANSALGDDAMHLNTTGSFNTAIGYATLASNTTGSSNTVIGSNADVEPNVSTNATAIGAYAFAGSSNSLILGSIKGINGATNSVNVGIGTSNPDATLEVAGGDAKINGITIGRGTGGLETNTAVGNGALNSNTTGNSNTAFGSFVLHNNNIGVYNCGEGYAALYNNYDGSFNTGLGYYALFNNISGNDNTSLGWRSLWNNTTGYANTAIGSAAGYDITTGTGNTTIGISSGCCGNYFFSTFLGPYTHGNDDIEGAVAIGDNAYVAGSNEIILGNASISSIGGYQPWSNFSDGRFKKNLKSDVPGLEFIRLLKPVTYTLDVSGIDQFIESVSSKKTFRSSTPIVGYESYRNSARAKQIKVIRTGFIAQEVEAAAQKLNYDFDGVKKPQNDKDFYALSYSQFVVPLVKAVQELSAENEVLKSENEILKTRIDKIEQLLSINSKTIKLSNASLGQSVPNPNSNNATITYNIPGDVANAQLIISDMGGKKIKQIQLSKNDNGVLNIDTSKLSAGTYSYSLFVDGKLVETKQMIVAK